MDLSRRRVLQGIGALAVMAATPLRWVSSAEAAPTKSGSTTSTSTSSPWLSRSSYVPLVGTAFTIGSATMTLAAIRDLTAQPVKEKAGVSDGRFSLLFTSGAAVIQGTQTVRHASLGETSLFVVPVGPKAAAPRSYEVIVNRLA